MTLEYSGSFKDIAKYRYGKTEPSSKERELFEAVSFLGESFNNYNSPTSGSERFFPSLNGKVVIEHSECSDTDNFIVYYEGNNVFSIIIGESDKITNYIPGEWEDKVLKCYYEAHQHR